MTKARYSYIICLNALEQEELTLLRKQNVKIIDIFRAGLKSYLKEVPKKLLNKAHKLV